MALRFQRYSKVVITTSTRAIAIDHLYIDFTINKGTDDTNISPSVINIYNPHGNLRNEIQRGDKIEVEAGYLQPSREIGLIFMGEITNKTWKRQSVDRILILRALSSHLVSLQGVSLASLGYSTATPVKEVMRQLAGQLMLNVDEESLRVFDSEPDYEGTFNGPPRQLLSQLSSAAGVSWRIEEKTLKFYRSGQSNKALGTLILDLETPIVGEFENEERSEDDQEAVPNLTFEAQLSSEYEISRAVRVREELSMDYAGDYAIIQITHRGDNENGPFMSKLRMEQAA